MNYTDEERAIFPLDRNDGAGPAAVDPQAAYRELVCSLRGEPLGGEGGLLERVQKGDDYTAGDAAAKLYPAVRKAFGLAEPALGPGGMTGCTERMCWKVLCDFLRFLQSKKAAPAS